MVSKVIEGRTSADNPIPAIPEPGMDLASMRVTVMRMREAIQAMTGQRGPRDFDLYQGLRTISRHVSEEGRERHAEIRELNEVIIEGDEVLALQYTELNAEVVSARQGEPSLSARVTELDQARIDGDTALATSVNTLSVEITNARGGFTNLSAKLTNMSEVSATADGALASSITTVSVNLDGRTANGNVKFIASGGIGGFSTTYSVYLEADNKWAGMTLGVAGGVGFAMFTVDQFTLYDGTTHRAVFGYDAGQFTFNANVKINGTLVVTETIDYPKLVNNAISQTAFNEGPGGATVILFCRAGAKLLLTSGIRSNGSGGSATSNPGVAVVANGVTIASYVHAEVVDSVTDTGGGIVTTYKTLATCITVPWTAPSSNIFGFNTASANDGKTIGYLCVLEVTR